MRVLFRFVIWPVVRIVVLMILAAVAGALYARGRMESRGAPDDDSVDLVAIFEGFELVSRATAFRGGTMVTWFGGGTLDLRDATLHPDGARLTVYALFGGAQVALPPDWAVDCRLIAVVGGVGDDRDGNGAGVGDLTGAGAGSHHEDSDRPTLTIDGVAAFGGVGITARPRGPSAR